MRVFVIIIIKVTIIIIIGHSLSKLVFFLSYAQSVVFDVQKSISSARLRGHEVTGLRRAPNNNFQMNTIGCKVIKVSMIFVDSVKYFLKRLQSYGSYEVAQDTTIMSSSKKYRRLQSFIGYDDFPNSEKNISSRLRGCKVTELQSLKSIHIS